MAPLDGRIEVVNGVDHSLGEVDSAVGQFIKEAPLFCGGETSKLRSLTCKQYHFETNE